MFKAAIELLGTDPTSLEGASALLQYVAAGGGEKGWMFPEFASAEDDEDCGESFVAAAMQRVGKALSKIAMPVAA